MIGKALRGRGAAGLVRYLYGPGKANEHLEPRLVASWDGDLSDAVGRAALAALEPAARPGGGRDFRALLSRLNEPLVVAGLTPGDRPVYHLIVAAAKADPAQGLPADRALGDVEWGRIARDYMHRTGLAPDGDDLGVRWVAVRHDDPGVHQHVHIVATLARQDGRRAWPRNDFYRIGEASRAAEKEYGLRATAPSDRTAAKAPTRAEVEKAARTGTAEVDRDRLRRLVRAAAADSTSARGFVERLRRDGVAVKVRHSTRPGREHEVTGYAVALTPDSPPDRHEPATAPASTTTSMTTVAGRAGAGTGEPVWFSGGKLAPDLTWPKLQAAWAGARAVPEHDLIPPARTRTEADAQRWTTATAAVGAAADHLERHLEQHRRRDPGAQQGGVRQGGARQGGVRVDVDPGVEEVVAAGAHLWATAARHLDRDEPGPATCASAEYDRAARPAWGRIPAPSSTASSTPSSTPSRAAGGAVRSPVGQGLRAAGLVLGAAARAPMPSEARRLQELLVVLRRLAVATAALREAQDRCAQAAAALRAERAVLDTVEHYRARLDVYEVWAARDAAASSFVTTVTTHFPRSSTITTGPTVPGDQDVAAHHDDRAGVEWDDIDWDDVDQDEVDQDDVSVSGFPATLAEARQAGADLHDPHLWPYGPPLAPGPEQGRGGYGR